MFRGLQGAQLLDGTIPTVYNMRNLKSISFEVPFLCIILLLLLRQKSDNIAAARIPAAPRSFQEFH